MAARVEILLWTLAVPGGTGAVLALPAASPGAVLAGLAVGIGLLAAGAAVALLVGLAVGIGLLAAGAVVALLVGLAVGIGLSVADATVALLVGTVALERIERQHRLHGSGLGRPV